MSIFKEAARLAEEWTLSKTMKGSQEAAVRMAGLLRAIAAMDVEAEAVAARFKTKADDLGDWQHVPATATLPLGHHALYVIEPLYTQQSLDAAILKAHDAAIEKAARIIESRKVGFADDDAELREMLSELQALKGQP